MVSSSKMLGATHVCFAHSIENASHDQPQSKHKRKLSMMEDDSDGDGEGKRESYTGSELLIHTL